MKNQPSVAIIIINWNGADDTIECLESIKKIDYPKHKIFLVDNGSSDDSVLKLRALPNPNFKLIETGKNLGFSGGNNVGIQKALKEGVDYILLLNNDTMVKSDFLTELVRVGDSDKSIGIVGPKIYYSSEPTRIWFNGGDFTWLGGGRHLQHDEIDSDPGEAMPSETEFMTGCALLIKSRVAKEIGPMEERFFLYYEDTEWSLRARKAGYKVMRAPLAKIYHKVSRSSEKIGNSVIHYYHIRNALLLSWIHAPKIVLMGIYIWSGTHYLKQILKIAIGYKPEVSKMIMRGIEDFWKNKFGKYEA